MTDFVNRRALLASGAGAAASLGLTACAIPQDESFSLEPKRRTFSRRNPAPESVIERTSALQYPNVSYFGDTYTEEFGRWLKAWSNQRQSLGLPDVDKPLSALALSGGSADGAFGSGILVGWGQRGDRPVFDLVTGISAGALVGINAISGRPYDGRLVTSIQENDFTDLLNVSASSLLLGAPAASSARKLKRVIDLRVDERLVDEVAEAYKQGRRYLVVTTNLDHQRPVIWDVTAIAASSFPNRVELIRLLMLATTAMPGLLPPVRLPVEYKGEVFDEIHSDGAVTQGLYLFPGGEDIIPYMAAATPHLRFDITMIINGSILPSYDPVNYRAMPLANQSLVSLLKSRTSSDVKALFRFANRMDTPARVTFLPSEVAKLGNSNDFNAQYMRYLFRYGLTRGLYGDNWHKNLPVAS